MSNYTGVFSGSDGRNEVKFSIEGELTEDKAISALKKAGYDLNTSFYTSGVLYSCDASRIDVEWDNGDTLSVFNTNS